MGDYYNDLLGIYDGQCMFTTSNGLKLFIPEGFSVSYNRSFIGHPQIAAMVHNYEDMHDRSHDPNFTICVSDTVTDLIDEGCTCQEDLARIINELLNRMSKGDMSSVVVVKNDNEGICAYVPAYSPSYPGADAYLWILYAENSDYIYHGFFSLNNSYFREVVEEFLSLTVSAQNI